MGERQGVLLYDHGGHNFTYELACSLAEQGQPIIYAYTAGVPSPHGRLADTASLKVFALCRRIVFERYRLPQRVLGELRLGFAATRLIGRRKCGQVITCNMPVIIVAIVATYCWATRRRFIVWFQDSQAGIAEAVLGSGIAVQLVRALEGWGLRRAERVIAISSAMEDEAAGMGVHRDRIHLLPNWAPLGKIPTGAKHNEWAVSHALQTTFVFLYSGTLGLKHSPGLLAELATHIREAALPAVVVVVSEGPVADSLEAQAASEGLPLMVMSFQPAEVLPDVLASADVCIVLLEEGASQFSVPSKVWSYMCAARPVLGAMPGENAAARVLVNDARAGLVCAPRDGDQFIKNAMQLYESGELRVRFGKSGRTYAEQHFSEQVTAEAFARAAGIKA